MRNYDKITFSMARATGSSTAEDYHELTGKRVNPLCHNDLLYAYGILTANRKFHLKEVNTALTIGNEVLTINNLTDELAEKFIKLIPEYAKYFTIKQLRDENTTAQDPSKTPARTASKKK